MVPFESNSGNLLTSAVSISRQPPPETGGFSRTAFNAALQRSTGLARAEQAAVGPQGAHWHSQYAPYLETIAMAHVPIRRLLLAVPRSGTDDASFVPRPTAASGAYTVTDIDGQSLTLRPEFAHILGHHAVRNELQRAVDAFDAAYGPSAAAAAAPVATTVLPSPVALPSAAPSPAPAAASTAVLVPVPVPQLNLSNTPPPSYFAMDTGDDSSGGGNSSSSTSSFDTGPRGRMSLVLDVPSPSGTGARFKMYVGDHISAGLMPKHTARSWALFEHVGITHVINCCVADFEGAPKPLWTPHARRGVQYGILVTNDQNYGALQDEHPMGQWPAVMALMREALHCPTGGSVLVHCFAGMNRSVTTAAVFMALHGFAADVRAAVDAIKTRRAAADPHQEYIAFGEEYVALVRERAAAAAARQSNIKT
jgi:hypothetical protein